MYKVLILRPDSWDGCTWYRLKNFMRHTGSEIDVQFMNFSLPVQQISQLLHLADAFIVRLSDQTSLNLLDNISIFDLKKPVILDIDDNYDNIDPLSDMYQVYGTQEVKLNTGEYLWKDGKNRFNIKKNKARLEKFHEVMRKVTAIVTTTFPLKNYANQFNRNVVVIPNAIDFDLFPRLDIRSNKEVKILWAGGSSHYPDLVEIAPVLGEIMKLYPQVHLYMYGMVFESLLQYLPKDRVHVKQWINADGHGYRLACADADIGICPLKDMEFNTYKSSVKFYEYAALGIPTLAKHISPYVDDIIHGQNGLLYRTMDEFRDNLVDLINDPIKRINIGQKGYEYVKKYRDIKDISKDWASFINQIIAAYRHEGPTVQS